MNRPLLTFLMLLLVGFCKAQSVRYQAAQRVKINLLSPTLIPFECHLAVDPQNKNHLLGAVLTADTTDPGNYFTTWISSSDHGQTWRSGVVLEKNAADPWSVITPRGNYVVSDIYNGADFTVGLRFSLDKGATWEKVISFGGGYDHAKMVVDESRGPYRGNMYLTATRSLAATERDPHILIVRMADNEKVLQKNVYQPFKNVNISAQRPVITSQGTLLIPVRNRGYFPANEEKSVSFSEASTWLIQSHDGGKTFSSPMFITSLTGSGHHIMAVGKNEKQRDHLYFFFVAANDGGFFVTKSYDLGESWSKPLRIDRADSVSVTTTLSAVAINDRGHISVLYREKVAERQDCYNTIVKISLDEGASFSETIQLNSQPGCPPDMNKWFYRAWPQGGDYSALIALPKGGFRALWSDASDGRFALYTTLIQGIDN